MNLLQFFKSLFKSNDSTSTGLIESPTDYRDVILGVPAEGDIPEEYMSPFKAVMKNQGSMPSCVGHSCAAIKEMLEQREQNNFTFDGDWVYKECKKIDGIPNYGGTYFRTGLKVLADLGIKPKYANKNPDIFRIGGYAQLDDTSHDGLKRALLKYGPILIGYKGSNAGWKTEFVRPRKAGETEWGHALALVGYTDTHLVVHNSWGKNKGADGYFFIPRGYNPIEAWVVLVDLPNNWKELLTKSDKPTYKFTSNLSFRMKNDDVIKLQDVLKHLGCMAKGIKSTGYFGRITLEAVKLFQLRYNISPQSGYFGPLSIKKMNEL